MTQFELSEFLDMLSVPFYCEFKASDIGQCLCKIRDDSVRPRHFLSADNEDEIKAILSEREGHSLHEIIDSDEPLHPIIDFNLPVETLNAITPKLSGGQVKNILCRTFRDNCLEIFQKWDKNTMSIADSSNEKKISLHVLTFGMRLPNIAKVSAFTELVRKKLPAGLQKKGIIDNIANIGSFKSFSLRMLGTPKYDKKTDKHVRIKKVIRPKDGSIFDFMIHPPNDDSRVIDSPLLVVPESEVNRCSKENNDTSSETTQADFGFVKSLLGGTVSKGILSHPPQITFQTCFH